jgi:hypothetical protein
MAKTSNQRNEPKETEMPGLAKKNDTNLNEESQINKLLQSDKEDKPNLPYGQQPTYQPDTNTLRIYHQNIRGAKLYNSWDRWKEGIERLAKMEVGIGTLVETNTKWNNKNTKEALMQARMVAKKTQISTSSSSETPKEDYLPGGAACILMNNWTGRKMENISYETGMGRWAGFKMRGKDSRNK